MFAVLHSDINSVKPGLLHLTGQPYECHLILWYTNLYFLKGAFSIAKLSITTPSKMGLFCNPGHYITLQNGPNSDNQHKLHSA